MTSGGVMFKLGLKLLCLTLLLSACRNGVEDEGQSERTQRLEVASLRLWDSQNITQSPIRQSPIEEKYYVVEACLVESALGERMAGHPAALEGGGLKSSLTDGNGCLYWEHRIAYDYSAQESCQTFHKTLFLADGQYRLELDYSIDTHTDKISDLSKSLGCLVQQLSESTPSEENDTNNSEGLASNGNSAPEPELEIDEIEFAYLRGNGLQPSDTKDLSYRAKLSTCLRYRSANSSVAHTNLQVSVKSKEEGSNPQTEIIETNYQGCFTKYFDSSYEQYAHSHWKEKSLEITLLNGPLKGYKLSQTFYLNPWESKQPDIFGIDDRYGKPSPYPLPDPKPNRLHLDRVSYVRVGNDIEEFKVNNYLGLTLSKVYHVTLSPFIDRGHLHDPESERYVPVNNGTFRLKFMLLAPQGADVMIDENNYSDFDYIAGTERIVEVQGGSINVPVNLAIRFVDLPRVATRVICAIKLEPIDDIGLRPTTGIGFFMAKRPWIRTNVFSSNSLQREESEYFADYEAEHREEIEEVLNQQDILDIPERENTESSAPLSSRLLSLEDFDELELSEEQQDGLKKHLYKQFIEQHLNNITQITEEHIYGDPDFFYGDRPLTLFVHHLRKRLGNVTFQIAGQEQEGDIVSLPHNAVSNLYQKGFNSTPENRQLVSQLCRTLFPKGNMFQRLFSSNSRQFDLCQLHPNKFFEMEHYKHSREIKESIPLWSNGIEFSIGSRLLNGHRDADSTVFSVRTGADIGGRLDTPNSIPLLNMFGARVRVVDVTYGWNSISSDERSVGDHLFVQKRIGAEKFNIRLKGLFENCVLLKPKYYVPPKFLDIGDTWAWDDAHYFIIGPNPSPEHFVPVPAGKHFYFCSKPQYEDFIESYYYMQAYVPNTTLMRDNFGPSEMKFIKVIRNTENFAQFQEVFEDNTRVYLMEDRVATETPDIKLYQTWGHLVDMDAEPSAVNKIMIDNIDGSYPGTIKLPSIDREK